MSKKLIDALNKDREGELSAIIQYMKHHYEESHADTWETALSIKK